MLSQFISQNEITILINVLFCVVAGFVIGAERESRGKDAGVSTHILVITGAMIFTFISSIVDPMSKSRIAAQVVSGIGFLGAGLILKEGLNVRNLTTAASLWVSAGIGMAFGYNFYVIGSILAVVVAITPRIPHINKRSPEATDTYTDENMTSPKTKRKNNGHNKV